MNYVLEDLEDSDYDFLEGVGEPTYTVTLSGVAADAPDSAEVYFHDGWTFVVTCGAYQNDEPFKIEGEIPALSLTVALNNLYAD